MKDILIIKDPSTIKALADGRRLAIVRILIEGPQTAEELSTQLGTPKSKLYYHLGELEKHGLIEVVETRHKRNLTQKVYQATAAFYKLDRDLFSQGEPDQDTFLQSIHSIMDATSLDIERTTQNIQPANLTQHISHGYRRLLLSSERRASFMEAFEQLLKEYTEPQQDNDTAHIISFFVYPVPHNEHETQG